MILGHGHSHDINRVLSNAQLSLLQEDMLFFSLPPIIDIESEVFVVAQVFLVVQQYRTTGFSIPNFKIRFEARFHHSFIR